MISNFENETFNPNVRIYFILKDKKLESLIKNRMDSFLRIYKQFKNFEYITVKIDNTKREILQKELENSKNNRKQVNYNIFIEKTIKYFRNNSKNNLPLIIIDDDLTAEGFNWFFGVYHRYSLVISMHRLLHKSVLGYDLDHFKVILLHELGHAFDLTYSSRDNVNEL